MLPSFPPEILDFIVDHLRDEPTALKACCLVSKSWVSRARRNLFAWVTFSSRWTNVFPDPSNSPGHHTRSLYLYDIDTIIAASTVAPNWVHHFGHIKELWVATIGLDRTIPISFIRLHGLSSTLKTLRLSNVSAPISEVLDLICSFPRLEDLRLHLVTTSGDADGRDIPSTSPSLTGTLSLVDPTLPVTRGLLDLPNGLRFSCITIICPTKDADSVMDFVPRCSDTLEVLTVGYRWQGAFSFSAVVGQCLTDNYSIYLKLLKCVCLCSCSWSMPNYHRLQRLCHLTSPRPQNQKRCGLNVLG